MDIKNNLYSHFLTSRPRRNRATAAIRDLVQENYLRPQDFILPIFLLNEKNREVPIDSLPGVNRMGLEPVYRTIENCLNLNVRGVILFPVVPESLKDTTASYSWDEGNFYLKAISAIKQRFPEIAIFTDVAMDPYSSDGHDGLVSDGKILNDETLEILGRMAVAQAEAGADMVGPSDMMDGRVGFIRKKLDEAGFTGTGIMAYTAKYASAFYGPFRDALNSAPRFGDKKTYQMNPANAIEALREANADMVEGADILMVKPAGMYLDIIALLKANCHLPVAAYQVSGEYAMICAAAAKGWIDAERAMLESLLCIKRSGASIIISYFALAAATVLQRN